MTVDVNARWNPIEKKVVYAFSFINVDGKIIHDGGFISKSAVKEEAKLAGATPEQMKQIDEQLKKIKPSLYKK